MSHHTEHDGCFFDTVISMMNRSSIFVLLMAIFTLPYTLHMGAQQTPSSEIESGSQQVEKPPMHIGGSVRPPTSIEHPQPKTDDVTSDPALPNLDKIKRPFSGKVLVYLWVDENGDPSHIRVVRGVGMGLDERAVDAVRHYKFKPATWNGKPVKVDLYIDINFELR